MADENLKRFSFSMPIMKAYQTTDKSGKTVRVLEGVASTTDRDLHGDKMSPDAIKSMADSLPQLKDSENGTLNAEHDTSWTADLGDITDLEVDKNNHLVMKAELNGTSGANDLWYLLVEKKKKLGLSIGGFVKSYRIEIDEKTDEYMRVFENVVLDHIAVVSQPANPNTWVSAIAKSVNKIEFSIGKELKEQVNLISEDVSMENPVTKTEEVQNDETKEVVAPEVVTETEAVVSEGEVISGDAVTPEAEAKTEEVVAEEVATEEVVAPAETVAVAEETKEEVASTEVATEEDKKEEVEVKSESAKEEESVASLRTFVEEGFKNLTQLIEKSIATEATTEAVDKTVELEKSVETLTAELVELKKKSTNRKGVTIEKFEDVEKSAKPSLEEALNKARVEHKGDPNLFVLLGKIRDEYSK